MRPLNWTILVAALVACAASREDVLAREIKYTVQGIGSGAFYTVPFAEHPFTNQPFEFSVFADTDNVQTFSFYHAVNNDSITAQVGTTTVTGVAGSSFLFSQVGIPGAYAFVQVPVGEFWDTAQLYAYSNALNGYDLQTEIGPLSVPDPSNQPPVSLYLELEQGFLSIVSTSQVTFRATFVPEPTGIALIVVGAVALLSRRRIRALPRRG
jgi:hypothetical protein